MEYFWRRGYRATSVDDLVRALGISRSSLYAVWNGKEALYHRAFQRYLGSVGMEALRPLEEVSDTRAAVEAVFETIARQISHDPLRRGCMMVNTITELSAVEPELARVAHEAKDALRGMFRRALDRRVAAGESSSDQADREADYLVTLFMGLRVLARTGPDYAQARAIVRTGLDAVFGHNPAA